MSQFDLGDHSSRPVARRAVFIFGFLRITNLEQILMLSTTFS